MKHLIKKLLRESLLVEVTDSKYFDFHTLPDDIKRTLFDEYDNYSHKTYDWNTKADELSDEEFTKFLYDNKNKSIMDNIDDIILKTTQDMILLKKTDLAEKKLKAFEELIVPVLGNEVLVPILTRFQQQVLLDPNATPESIEKGFEAAKDIINKDGDLDYDKIETDLVKGVNHPLDLNYGDRGINLPNFERFVAENPEYQGVFNDWEKLFNEYMNLSLKELHAYRNSTPIDKIRKLRNALIKIKKSK
jgi:hypothetical protein